MSNRDRLPIDSFESTRRGRRSTANRPPAFRLKLEALEDRSVPVIGANALAPVVRAAAMTA